MNIVIAGSADRLEQAVFAGLMAVLVWAPLPFGSNREWAGALLCALVSALLLAWLVLALFGRARFDTRLWQIARWPLLLLTLVQLWVVVQLLPLPRGLVQVVSPRAYAWHLAEGPLRLSLDPAASYYYLLRGCAVTVGFFLVLALVNSQQRVKLMLQVLVFSGTMQATYGAFMVLSGLELGFLVEKYVGKGVTTGTFVNRNHLAGYLVLCLSAGIGLQMSQLVSVEQKRWRDRLRGWLELMLSAKFRLRVYLAVMVVALVLTRSRMGNIAFFSALAAAGLITVINGRQFSWRLVLFLGSLLVVDVLILGRWFGFDKLMARLEQTGAQPVVEQGRYWLDAYTVDYIRDFSLTGSGGGSFYGVFPSYQGPSLPGFYEHAHNDYLEFSAELGVPIMCVLLVFVGLAGRQAIAVLRRRRTPLYRGAAFAVLMSIAWAALHSLADFNLQIPANALTFTSIMALAFSCRMLPASR